MIHYDPPCRLPLAPNDLAVPAPAVADEPAAQAAELSAIKAFDRLAKEAGMDQAVLAETERQEWRGR